MAKRANGKAIRRTDTSGSFAENYLSYLLARASHIVASGFHARLRTWKLTIPEYRVLACLDGAEGLAVGDLAAMAIMAQPRSDARDRRRVLIHLTPAGRARAAPMLRAAKEHEAKMLAPFDAEERAVIMRALDLLIGQETAQLK
jgi:MarR family transcriptional regulator, organic hydroperoxide resistance regulator